MPPLQSTLGLAHAVLVYAYLRAWRAPTPFTLPLWPLATALPNARRWYHPASPSALPFHLRSAVALAYLALLSAGVCFFYSNGAILPASRAVKPPPGSIQLPALPWITFAALGVFVALVLALPLGGALMLLVQRLSDTAAEEAYPTLAKQRQARSEGEEKVLGGLSTLELLMLLEEVCKNSGGCPPLSLEAGEKRALRRHFSHDLLHERLLDEGGEGEVEGEGEGEDRSDSEASAAESRGGGGGGALPQPSAAASPYSSKFQRLAKALADVRRNHTTAPLRTASVFRESSGRRRGGGGGGGGDDGIDGDAAVAAGSGGGSGAVEEFDDALPPLTASQRAAAVSLGLTLCFTMPLAWYANGWILSKGVLAGAYATGALGYTLVLALFVLPPLGHALHLASLLAWGLYYPVDGGATASGAGLLSAEALSLRSWGALHAAQWEAAAAAAAGSGKSTELACITMCPPELVAAALSALQAASSPASGRPLRRSARVAPQAPTAAADGNDDTEGRTALLHAGLLVAVYVELTVAGEMEARKQAMAEAAAAAAEKLKKQRALLSALEKERRAEATAGSLGDGDP